MVLFGRRASYSLAAKCNDDINQMSDPKNNFKLVSQFFGFSVRAFYNVIINAATDADCTCDADENAKNYLSHLVAVWQCIGCLLQTTCMQNRGCCCHSNAVVREWTKYKCGVQHWRPSPKEETKESR